MVLLLSLFCWCFIGYCRLPSVDLFCYEAVVKEAEEMSRIDAYLRAIEEDKLDEYYYRKDHPSSKPFKYTKGGTNGPGQMKNIGRG